MENNGVVKENHIEATLHAEELVVLQTALRSCLRPHSHISDLPLVEISMMEDLIQDIDRELLNIKDGRIERAKVLQGGGCLR